MQNQRDPMELGMTQDTLVDEEVYCYPVLPVLSLIEGTLPYLKVLTAGEGLYLQLQLHLPEP